MIPAILWRCVRVRCPDNIVPQSCSCKNIISLSLRSLRVNHLLLSTCSVPGRAQWGLSISANPSVAQQCWQGFSFMSSSKGFRLVSSYRAKRTQDSGFNLSFLFILFYWGLGRDWDGVLLYNLAVLELIILILQHLSAGVLGGQHHAWQTSSAFFFPLRQQEVSRRVSASVHFLVLVDKECSCCCDFSSLKWLHLEWVR